MREKIYRNKKVVLLIGISIITIGGIMGFYTYGNEPEETISGIVSGIGFGVTFITLTLKSPNKQIL
ncbi:hypothetical protein V1T75_06920 [Tenacibaculum sp. FZY0031]|uniref:hypothetical protein n=1 Tax=unclassified Tenacibaculum TaxID=2635139 RepID=UPI002EC2E07D|nr:hypothetical protein [Tenacibaculum sp. FZY0031]